MVASSMSFHAACFFGFAVFRYKCLRDLGIICIRKIRIHIQCAARAKPPRALTWGRQLKMRSKIDPETMKIQAPGAALEPSGDPLGGLGVSWGAS